MSKLNTSADLARADLLAALNAAMREVSGQGVLYSQAAAAKLGVNSTDLECLGYVVAGDGVTAGNLAHATGLTSGAITGVIDRLERAGLAIRSRVPDDRRKVVVQATAEVAARVMPLYEPIANASAAALAPYSDADLALLLDFLARSHEAAKAALAELRGRGDAPAN
jgi:DNA-binding MarR family transcriptional regulator